MAKCDECRSKVNELSQDDVTLHNLRRLTNIHCGLYCEIEMFDS